MESPPAQAGWPPSCAPSKAISASTVGKLGRCSQAQGSARMVPTRSVVNGDCDLVGVAAGRHHLARRNLAVQQRGHAYAGAYAADAQR